MIFDIPIGRQPRWVERPLTADLRVNKMVADISSAVENSKYQTPRLSLR
jgi:hypothetical protein